MIKFLKKPGVTGDTDLVIITSKDNKPKVITVLGAFELFKTGIDIFVRTLADGKISYIKLNDVNVYIDREDLVKISTPFISLKCTENLYIKTKDEFILSKNLFYKDSLQYAGFLALNGSGLVNTGIGSQKIFHIILNNCQQYFANNLLVSN